MKRIRTANFVAAKDSIAMSPGEALATLRRLQEMTQSELAESAGMTQANISSMESGRQQIGRDRAIALATALRVHPAVIMFPNYRVASAARRPVRSLRRSYRLRSTTKRTSKKAERGVLRGS